MRGDGSAIWKVIIWLVGAVVIALLALENQHPVSLQLFFWHLPHISLALIVFSSMLLGAIVGAGGLVWNRFQTLRAEAGHTSRRENLPKPATAPQLEEPKPVEKESTANDLSSVDPK